MKTGEPGREISVSRTIMRKCVSHVDHEEAKEMNKVKVLLD